jgi:hypothetical protein
VAKISLSYRAANGMRGVVMAVVVVAIVAARPPVRLFIGRGVRIAMRATPFDRKILLDISRRRVPAPFVAVPDQALAHYHHILCNRLVAGFSQRRWLAGGTAPCLMFHAHRLCCRCRITESAYSEPSWAWSHESTGGADGLASAPRWRSSAYASLVLTHVGAVPHR